MADFKAKYEVNDGYAGGSRPQKFTIRAGDFDFPDNATDDQIIDIFYEAVEEDMRQKISFHNVNQTEFLAWAREQIAAQKSEA